MAQLADSAAFVPSLEADYLEIERWYADLIAKATPPSGLEWEPVRLGPTWQYDDVGAGWSLPEASLGWRVLAFNSYWLRFRGRNWTYTPEQARFILWYYAVDSVGDFVYHSAMLQRLKGWGKDPLAATISFGSLHAPVVFDSWAGDRPVGRDDPDAWTQIAAVAQDQTKNTMKLFPSLISKEAQDRFGIQIGKLNVWSDGDRRQIEAITSSPLAIEGGRPHQIIRAETQNWDSSNGGHDMAGAMEGNAAKAEVGRPARILDIFNAYRPGRDSVAERAREAWESTQGEHATHADYGVLLDSLEAPPKAPLTAEAAPGVIRSIAGDATWLDTKPNGRIVKSILNPDNSPSESRRKWYNQITGVEDAWVEPTWIDQNQVDEKLEPGDSLFLFGDGSKSGDDTGLVACRLSDGFLQTLHFQHPTGSSIVDVYRLDADVEDAFDTYKVLGFFFDPSHAKSDDAVEDDRFWWPLVDDWHKRWGRRLKLQATPQHSVAFDMLAPSNQKRFQPLVSQVAEEMKNGECPHHGGARLREHMKNARRREGRYGITIGKEHRSSARKIDLAVCAIGARMMRREYQLKTKTKGTPGNGRVLILE